MGVSTGSPIPVALGTLLGAESFPFDLYTRSPARRGLALYLARGQRLSASDLEVLGERGIRTLYVAPEGLGAYSQYLQECVLADGSSAVAAQVCLLHETHRSVFLQRLSDNDVPGVVAVAEQLGEGFVRLVCDQDVAAESLLGVLRHDYYTYTHVTNVSVCAVAIGRELGISDRSELAQLATGGLLHDLGKRHIGTDLLNKAGRLSSSEFRVVQHHAQLGFEELCVRHGLSWGQLMMVYQHHERMCGGGYPTGITGKEIHPWARICAVADIFDALTSHRPYRQPMPQDEVVQYLSSEAERSLDPEIVRCWTSLLKQTCSTNC